MYNQFFMKYSGYFVKGVFTPDRGMKKNYDAFKRKIEAGQLRVTISIKEAVVDASENQVGLFWVIVNMVVESTGSSSEQVIDYFKKWKPRHIGGWQETKSFSEMNTKEFSEFIESCIMNANEDFHLNLKPEELENGKTRITNDRT